jgi:spore photoproduct lyase
MQIWKERWYEVYNLKLWQNCNLWCKYCYLLSSNKMYPELAIYWNLPEEVEKFLKKNKDKKILFNIWEHTDSFLLDSITQYSLFLYSLLDKYPNLVIESRTKLINLYLLFPPHERFILSFSISINNLDLFWETKKVFQKLDYIKKITFDWYNVALKFDPIISIDLYEDEFFSKIFQIKNENIDHFSIGTLRFSRNLQIITEYVYNFKINLKDFEFINWKYVVKNREKIYNFFLGKLKPLNKDFYISMNPIINKPNI